MGKLFSEKNLARTEEKAFSIGFSVNSDRTDRWHQYRCGRGDTSAIYVRAPVAAGRLADWTDSLRGKEKNI